MNSQDKQDLQDHDLPYKMMYLDFVVEIIDNGIGIKKENLSKLFMEFNKLDEQSQMNRHGTGLGLTISRKMVRQMGGDITVQSEFGKGTSFFILFRTKAQVMKDDLKQFERKDSDCKFDKVSLRVGLSKDSFKEGAEQICGFRNEKFQPQSCCLLKDQMQDSVEFFQNLQQQNQNFSNQVMTKNNNQQKEQESINQLNSAIFNKFQEFHASESSSGSDDLIQKISFEKQPVFKENNEIYQENEILKQVLILSLHQNNSLLRQYSFGQANISKQDLKLNIDQQQNQIIQNSKGQLNHNKQQISIYSNLQNTHNQISKISQLSVQSSQEPFLKIQLDQVIQEEGKLPPSQIDKGDQIPNYQFSSFEFIKNQSKQEIKDNNYEFCKQVKSHFSFGSNQSYNQFVELQKSNQKQQPFYSDSQVGFDNFINQKSYDIDEVNDQNDFQVEIQKLSQSSNEEKLIQNQKSQSSLSQSFFFSHQEISKQDQFHSQNQMKCLIANDEHFQLKIMGLTCQKQNLKVSLSENGLQAFYKVRSFIESYGKVRKIMQDPKKHFQKFHEDDYKVMKKAIKNYDFIILDLNMPILNGFDACKRICEVYQSFKSLPDYEDPKSIDQQEKQHLENIDKLFTENEFFENEGSLENIRQLKFDQSNSSKSNESLKKQLKNLKLFYNFKRYFGEIPHMKPLMIACSADINSKIKNEALKAGFDKVIQAPLTESFLKEVIKEIEHKNHIKKIMKMVVLDKKSGWRSQEIGIGEVNTYEQMNKTIKQDRKISFGLDGLSN